MPFTIGSTLIFDMQKIQMKLDNFFSFLVPRDHKFFPLFVELANNLVEISGLLVEIAEETETSESEKKIVRVKELKLNGDQINRNLLRELNRTYITPLDRGDIHNLISMLNDIADDIYAATKRIHCYRIHRFPEAFIMVANLIHTAIQEIYHVLNNVHTINDFKFHTLSYMKIGDMESKVDDICRDHLALLFDQDFNTIDLIKKRDIMINLEKAINKCDKISKIFSTLMIKMN